MHKGLFFLIFVAVVLASFFWWNLNLSPVNSRNHDEVMFTVPQGSGIRAISKSLKAQGLIRNDIIFTIMARQSGLDKKIQAGDFSISPSLSSKEIAIRLSKGVEDVWVTIPEGKRAEEVALILKDKIPTYDDTWEDALKAHEGYLFPDTYLISHNATIETVITTLTSTFDQRYKQVTTNTSGLSQAQVVTMASLIEREARHDQDRPLISSVMHNRLNIGMALQIDATVQYAIGSPSNWWPTLNDSGRNIAPNSPYNTYTNTGLPPTPIANPGVKALQAAANPANTNYFYYITDKNGINHYAATVEQHNANIRKYGL